MCPAPRGDPPPPRAAATTCSARAPTHPGAPYSSRCGDKVEVTSLPCALLVLLLIAVLYINFVLTENFRYVTVLPYVIQIVWVNLGHNCSLAESVKHYVISFLYVVSVKLLS
jgi:hypothetical protein